MIALLIRHGDTPAVDRYLAGRLPNLHLNDAGRAQARRLPTRLAGYAVTAVYSSPLERAVETAETIAAANRLPVRESEALIEMDFGRWTGRSFADLAGSPEWQTFNTQRCSGRAPDGERLADVQARVVALLETLADQHGDDTIAIVSHAEVIRSAVLHYLTVSLDLFQRVEISPASITALELADWGPRFLCINDHELDLARTPSVDAGSEDRTAAR